MIFFIAGFSFPCWFCKSSNDPTTHGLTKMRAQENHYIPLLDFWLLNLKAITVAVISM